jgi:hypothetical protein
MSDGHSQAAHGDRLARLDHPLRNRVTPSGELIATTHRGTMYGNRGVLHNDDLALVRRYQVRRWLVCVLEFRGPRRPIMRPRRYTELFFLDEAVALAAGHRHAAYQSFRTTWTAALAMPAKPAADDIDRVLHWERRLVGGPALPTPRRSASCPTASSSPATASLGWSTAAVCAGGPRPGTPTGLIGSMARPRC